MKENSSTSIKKSLSVGFQENVRAYLSRIENDLRDATHDIEVELWEMRNHGRESQPEVLIKLENQMYQINEHIKSIKNVKATEGL